MTHHQLEMPHVTPRELTQGGTTLRLWPDGTADGIGEEKPLRSIEDDARWMLDMYERAAKSWGERAAFVREWMARREQAMKQEVGA